MTLAYWKQLTLIQCSPIQSCYYEDAKAVCLLFTMYINLQNVLNMFSVYCFGVDLASCILSFVSSFWLVTEYPLASVRLRLRLYVRVEIQLKAGEFRGKV